MPASAPKDSGHITHLFNILSSIILTRGDAGLRQTFCPFLRVALRAEGRTQVRQEGGLGPRWGHLDSRGDKDGGRSRAW